MQPPDNVRNVLVHSCCAPCSGAMVKAMHSSPEIDYVVVFVYNPNIHRKLSRSMIFARKKTRHFVRDWALDSSMSITM